MEQADFSRRDWAEAEDVSTVTPLFLLLFMVTTTWIMANIYRAVIITEFSNTVCTFGHGARPRDLLPDEWPSFSPCVRGHFGSHFSASVSLARRSAQARSAHH